MEHSLKVVILAGGLGTRLSEETAVKPKPLVEIGPMPIVWHIMKHYDHFGFTDFIICLGYKGYKLKEWFHHYFVNQSDVTFDFATNAVTYHKTPHEKWRITLVDTGEATMTGGRIKRIQPYVENQPFMATYGDGLSNINLKDLLSFHRQHGKIATLSAANPEGRFGALQLEGSQVISFREKKDNQKYVNAGFFVLNPKIFDYIRDDSCVFEQEPLETLANQGQLEAYCHDGFWKPMDGLNDKVYLENLWATGNAPWRIWSS